jgi:hypothetical protein
MGLAVPNGTRVAYRVCRNVYCVLSIADGEKRKQIRGTKSMDFTQQSQQKGLMKNGSFC